MTPYEFITKWRASTLTERSASQQHFLDLCELLQEPKPAEADPSGQTYCFERGARKDTGASGWADVWKRHHFAWEYKGKRANLDSAFDQLRQYALALENPPLLIVSDMQRFRIRTNWTNCVSQTHEFSLDDLADAGAREKLKWAFSDPERLRPGETRQSLTEQAAQSFATVAQSLRERGHDPHVVAHFVNRLVFCMFADDVGLLPGHMFTRMLQQAQRTPAHFAELAGDLFRVMASGGRVGFETVDWFNGGLFDDDMALPLERPDIDTVLAAATLDWSEIDPSILGTLFERGLDPSKRAQLGAHYTDRDKVMLIVEPVVVRPWLMEWTAEKVEIAAELDRANAAKSRATRTKRRNEAERRYREFLNRLRAFTVLDPACGSGNFLYLALQALKDLEHRVQFEAEALGFERQFSVIIGPANVKGIEINPYAAELARVSVWIGEIQWMRRNGFSESHDPILKPLDNIECRDAILTADDAEPDWPEADVVIGNPPFLGGKLLITNLGEGYVSRMFATYADRVPAEADLVCYWFEKAGQQVASGKAKRAGLVATNSIRGGANRRALQAATN
ncbi:MAG: class I SAM-dependent DNA methyltransferase, partial [Gemmatimonadota bacterium]|nr:class I SAM-dependent DNA methyltransferase [Gemmatimonadota bacterium]